MKKIMFILLIMGIFTCLFGDSLVGQSLLATRAKMFVMDSDSLIATSSGVTDGLGNTMPFKISASSFRLDGTDKLEFNGADHYAYAKSADELEIKGKTNLTLNAGTKIQFFSASNYMDTSNNLVMTGDITGVDGTFSGDVTISDDLIADSTYVRTLQVTEATTLTGAVTASGGVTGDLTGDVTSTGTSSFATVSASGAVTLTSAGTALDVDNNVNIDGTLTVDGASTLTGAITASGGLTGDVTGDITGDTFTDKTGDGVVIDSLLIYNGDILLNGSSNFISFDTDDDTYLYSDTDDVIDIKINNSDDFTFSGDKFTAISGSSILTNTISETTADNGVTIDGCSFESWTNTYNIYAPSGKYVALSNAESPTDHGLTARTDLFVGGKLEVDDNAFFDGDVSMLSGKTFTVYDISLGGTDPTLNPTDAEGGTANDLFISGGENTNGVGGDLYLDGGSGTTTDGDVILGKSDGMVSFNTAILIAESVELTCDGGGVNADLTEYINYIVATANDTITVPNGTAGQVLKIATKTNASTYDIHVVPTNCGWGTETILDSKTAACELHYYDGKWYILSITD